MNWLMVSGGIAGLADHVEERPPQIEASEQIPEPSRVDRVGDVQSEILVRHRRGRVAGGLQRGVERARAERGAADPEHHQIVEAAAHLACECERSLEGRLLVRQLGERQRAGAALFADGRMNLAQPRQDRLEIGIAQAFIADQVRHHAVQIDAQALLVAPTLALEGSGHGGAL